MALHLWPEIQSIRIYFWGFKIFYQYFHTSEKLCDCDQFEWSFKHPGSLKCHESIHTVEKPYICDLMREVLQAVSCFEPSPVNPPFRKVLLCEMCQNSIHKQHTVTLMSKL